jgi:hypothetical protein
VPDGTQAPGTHGKKSMAPFLFGALAILCFGAWLSCILFDIQTTEGFLGGPAVKSLVPNLAILVQPVAFATGAIDPNMVGPVLIGWIVEILYLSFTFVQEAAHAAILKYNKALGGFFKTYCLAAVIFNGWTAYNAGFVTSGFWPQFIFAAALGGAVLFFAILGICFFRLALSEW